MNNKIMDNKAYEKSPLLSAPQAAKYLGVKTNTLYSWRCSKAVVIPFVRIGRHYKYLLSDLDSFIESQRKS